MSKIRIFFAFAVAVILLSSCKTTERAEEKTVEGMYEKAISYFQGEDWKEASQLFEVIKLQYGASQYADDAQYYLAEINFKKEEFILAAYNYNSLRRTYPTSPFFKISLYKAAICYYQLSPPYDRDPEYTLKAIESLQDYQRLYSGDSLYDQAGKYIDELRNKLARRDFETAKLYEKLYSPKSALVYYEAVINDYPDTEFYEEAYFDKIKTLVLMKKKDEAQPAIRQYKDLFPKGRYITEVRDIEQKNKQ